MTDKNLDRRDFVRSVGMVAAMPAIVSAAPSILGGMPRREEELTAELEKEDQIIQAEKEADERANQSRSNKERSDAEQITVDKPEGVS